MNWTEEMMINSVTGGVSGVFQSKTENYCLAFGNKFHTYFRRYHENDTKHYYCGFLKNSILKSF